MPHCLQKSSPKRVPKESVSSQERRFRAGLCSCPRRAWPDPSLLLCCTSHVSPGLTDPTRASGWTSLPEWGVQSPGGSPEDSCAQVGCTVSCGRRPPGLDGRSRRCQFLPAPNNGFIHSCFLSSKALTQTFSWCTLAELVQEHERPYI